MRGRTRRPRGIGSTLALAAILAALPLGCRDSGLPDRNLPLDQARQRTYAYSAYQAQADTVQVWEVGGRRWLAGAAVETIESRLLEAVASPGGTPVYALRWDREPHDRLYLAAGENRWRVVEPID